MNTLKIVASTQGGRFHVKYHGYEREDGHIDTVWSCVDPVNLVALLAWLPTVGCEVVDETGPDGIATRATWTYDVTYVHYDDIDAYLNKMLNGEEEVR